MGHPTGFLDIERQLPEREQPQRRTRHFREFENPPPEQHSTKQAARCMDCGVPFCHSGCPLGNLIPDFNDAVYRRDWRSAYELLASTNNFPEFTGRICPAPCEAACVLSINNDPVTIEHIEKEIIERAFAAGWIQPRIPELRSGKTVAIIGSGPAGLACADQLNQAGHSVTVFEKSDRPGGLLRYGIPDFKLEKRIIDRRLAVLQAAGISFRTGVNVGVDLPAEELTRLFDAVVLCGGSSVPRDLALPGRHLSGIHFAMDFLEQTNRRVSGDPLGKVPEIDVRSKHVVVIGGGDTGSDCVGSSNRLGAASITQIEIMGKPPLSRGPENPWPRWPMTLRTSSSHEEGCQRSWAIKTNAFIGNEREQLTGIQVVDVESGVGGLVEKPGTERILRADIVLIAAGFLHPLREGLLKDLGVALDSRGNIAARDYRTTYDGIYAAGDIRRGQSLVVWAIAEGREAARTVHADLGGAKTVLPSNDVSLLAV